MVTALLVLLVFAPAAQACSCGMSDARTELHRSDAAFIGTVVTAPEDRFDGDDVAWEFAVERSVKGDLKERVTVWTSGNGSSCGMELQKGQRTGLFLYRQGERWASGLCSKVNPDRLLEAAQSLPAPDGSGPAAFLVAGQLGDVGVVALDDKGRTLSYGKADGSSMGLSVCPGARRAAALRWGPPGGSTVVLYDLPSLGVVRTRDLRHSSQSAGVAAVEVGCADAAGEDLYVFQEKQGESQSDLTLYRLRRDEAPATVWTGKGGYNAVFDPGGRFAVVPVRDPASLVRVDLPSGRASTLAALPAPPTRLVMHPSGRSVLTLSRSGYEEVAPARLVVTSAEGRRLGERELPSAPSSGGLLWSGDDHVTVSVDRGTVQTFDGRLRPLGEWQGELGRATERGGRIYDLDREGVIRSAPAKTGGLVHFRDLPDGTLSEIVAVPAQAAASTTTTSAPTTTTTDTVTPATSPEAPVDATPVDSGTEVAGDPAASTGDASVPGGLGLLALAALIGSGYATQAMVRRRLLRTPATPA